MLIAAVSHGQSIDPYEKAVLDKYYLGKTNDISGTLITVGTLPGNRLEDGAVDTVQLADDAITSDKISNGTIVNVDVAPAAAIDPTKIAGEATTKTTAFAGDVAGTWNLLLLVTPRWKFSTTIPAAATNAAVEQTISCADTNYLYVCVTNSWAGPGTNWMRVALEPF